MYLQSTYWAVICSSKYPVLTSIDFYFYKFSRKIKSYFLHYYIRLCCFFFFFWHISSELLFGGSLLQKSFSWCFMLHNLKLMTFKARAKHQCRNLEQIETNCSRPLRLRSAYCIQSFVYNNHIFFNVPIHVAPVPFHLFAQLFSFSTCACAFKIISQHPPPLTGTRTHSSPREQVTT